VTQVAYNGEVVILEDGSVWLVDFTDQDDAALWLATLPSPFASSELIGDMMPHASRKYNYFTYGPVHVVNREGKISLSPSEFKQECEAYDDRLAKSCGCYVFVLKHGETYMPWYVGKATKSFEQEVLTPDKLRKYERVIRARNGRPYLYLIARRTQNQDRLSNGGKHLDISRLEKMLIDMALRRNSDLVNVSETKFLRNLSITGLFNSPPGGLSKSDRELQKVFKWNQKN
jgi:hypothetical protein